MYMYIKRKKKKKKKGGLEMLLLKVFGPVFGQCNLILHIFRCLPLIQEGKLSVTCERMCAEYWLTA